MPLFIDLEHVPVGVCNDTLEGLYKALSDGHDHGDDGIWAPLDSPFIQRLVELFTERGLLRLDTVHQKFLEWQSGGKHKAANTPVMPPPGGFQKWTPAELELARLYIESLPPAQWTLNDHMLAIELVIQTYMPVDTLVTEAEWLATKATLMGKVQANLEKKPTKKQADLLISALPASMAEAVASGMMMEVMQFAVARAAENVRALSEDVRHKMRTIVAADVEQRMLGAVPPGTSSLQTKLMDAFAVLNRDWRRIAVTEAGEAQTQGFIASLKPGTRVQRVERYAGACAFCRRIDGAIATVVEASAEKKDPDKEVWLGKNNVGRSASPRKRVGDVLVERDASEMWWLPAGLAHPHCRGRWVALGSAEPGDDPGFASLLDSILGA